MSYQQYFKTLNQRQYYLALMSGLCAMIMLPKPARAQLPLPYRQVCQTLVRAGTNVTADQKNFVAICSPVAGLASTADDLPVSALRHEEAAAQGSSSLQSTRQQVTNIDQRLDVVRRARQGGGAGDSEGNALLESSRWGIFVNGDAHKGTRKRKGDIGGVGGLGDASIEASGQVSQHERAFEFNSQQVTVGADYRLPGERFVLGGAFGLNRQNGKLKSDLGKIDLDGFHTSLYGSYTVSDKAYLDGIVSLGKNNIEASRAVPKLGSLTEFGKAFAKPDSKQFSASLGGGYDIVSGQFTITPYSRLDYTKTTIDAYTETVDSNASRGMELAVKKQKVHSMVGSLGVRVSSPRRTANGVIVPQASLEFAHEFKNDPRAIEASLLVANGLSGITATPIAETTEPDRNSLKLGVGVSAMFGKGRSGFVHLESMQGSKDYSDNALKVGYRMEF